MVAERVKIGRDLGEVQDAIKFSKDLVSARKAAGEDPTEIVMAHQGAEPTFPDGILGDILTNYDPEGGPGYHTDIGGPPEVREIAATHARMMHGLDAVQSNTYVLNSGSRMALGPAFDVSSRGDGSRTSLPDRRWAMVNGKVRKARLKPVAHATRRDSFVASVIQTIEEHPDTSSIYVDADRNPSGIQVARTQLEALKEYLDSINEGRPLDKRVAVLLDLPYFMSRPQRPQVLSGDTRGGTGLSILESGYDGLFQRDGITPWVALISYSKAYGPKPGLSKVITHDDYALPMKKELASLNGAFYSKPYLMAAGESWKPENLRHVAARYTQLREKFARNRDIMGQAIGEYLADGDPGLVGLSNPAHEDPKLSLLGRKVTGPRTGETYEIKDAYDLAECLGNEFNLVGVPSSVNGAPLELRLALKGTTEEATRGGENYSAGIAHILQSPMLAS